MNPSDYYMTFVAIQRYFKGSYDFFKYNGKLKVSHAAIKKHEYVCIKLSKKYDPEDFKLLCVSNLMRDINIWITDLIDERSDECYHQMKSRVHSLKYNFNTDLKTLLEYGDLNFVLTPKDSTLPISYKLAKMGEIKLESLIILDRLLDIFDVWSKYGDVISGQYIDLWEKYSKFIDIPDISVYKDIVLSSCNSVDKNV